MWRNQIHALVLLTELTGNATFMWNNAHKKAFDDAKAIMSKETMSHCPNYKLPFLIFPDTSDVQLGAYTSQTQATNVDKALKQDYCPVFLHGRKLSD